jgi:hypothetical protein
MLSVADMSTVCQWKGGWRDTTPRLIVMKCRFLDEWGWSEPGVVLLVDGVPSDSKPNSFVVLQSGCHGFRNIAACPVGRLDNFLTSTALH